MDRIITSSRDRSSLLSTHKVLRNTYFLLSLTLAFSAKESGFKACDTDVQAGVGFNDFTLAAIKEGNLRLRLSTVEYRLQWIQAGEYIITLCAP